MARIHTRAQHIPSRSLLRAATRYTPQCTRVLRVRFRGRVHTRYPSGVIVIARPAGARSFHRRRAAHTHSQIHTYTNTHVYARVWEYPRVGVGGTGIFLRPAQILLRAGINLLPAFRSRSQTFRSYGGKRTVERGRRDAAPVQKGEIGKGGTERGREG